MKKKIIIGLGVIAIVFVGYRLFSGKSVVTQYALAAVTKGTLITSVSGSGQVSVSNQIDVKPKASGDVTYVAVKNGQQVRSGALLVQLDARDALKTVRDAQINLEQAQISLQKLQLGQQADLPKLQDNLTTTQNNLTQAYQNGFNEIANSFLDLPGILTGIRGVLYDTTVGTTGQFNSGAYQDLVDQNTREAVAVMVNQAMADYLTSSEKYKKNLEDYKSATRYSPNDQIVSLIGETLETAKTMAQSVKDEQNLLDTVVESLKRTQPNRTIPSAIAQYQSDIASYIGKLNNHITSLNNTQSTITASQQSIDSIKRDMETSTKSDPLDVASQENALKQRQAALQDARENLANYSVRAPFAGTVAKINVIRGTPASSATAIATMIAPQRLAELSLNEVDVAKLAIGQKATLTFDAVPDLTITGAVFDIDAIGTVSQGVVTYNIKIGFDTQDDRIKPGMSVSAAIITDVKTDALLVPSSAIKSGMVQMPDETINTNQLTALISLTKPPRQQAVQTGLSNDSLTEVMGGLKEGDVVITRTITTGSAAATPATQTRSLFGGGGGGARLGR